MNRFVGGVCILGMLLVVYISGSETRTRPQTHSPSPYTTQSYSEFTTELTTTSPDKCTDAPNYIDEDKYTTEKFIHIGFPVHTYFYLLWVLMILEQKCLRCLHSLNAFCC